MKSFCLEINLEELAYSLHHHCCEKLPGESTSFRIVNVSPEEDQKTNLLQAQKSLLPSWNFRPCSCVEIRTKGSLVS